ncbi:MAG: hypothetical protein ACOYYJ_04170 [Chloroflexota bacterium]
MATQQKNEVMSVICLRNEDNDDLLVGKVYRTLPDEVAAREGYIRVIDESGEDYLYPASFFVPIELPLAAERALFPLAGD